jgi:hypothetical protein
MFGSVVMVASVIVVAFQNTFHSESIPIIFFYFLKIIFKINTSK